MYKIAVVAGNLRGEEFELNSGENVIGRSEECEIHLDVQGVSKKHCSITVTDDVAYLKDLDSSNGTFVNGKLIRSMTVKDKDKITLPDLILQLVYVKEKKIIIKRTISDDEDDDFMKGGDVPPDLPGKIKHYFKYKIMPMIYGINEEYEWRVLMGILLSVFILVTITLTIFPVLNDSKNILLRETAKRGAHYAEEIGRMNARALEKKQLDRINTNFLGKIDDVDSYELFDLEGRIVRPLSKLNEYISDTFSIQAKEKLITAKNNDGSYIFKKRLGDGVIGIGKKIMAYNPKFGIFEPVGIIAIRFAPASLVIEEAKSSQAYMESLVTSAIVSVIFFGMVYYLTVLPFEEMKFQIEEAIRGKRRTLESKYLMGEINPLRNSINSMLQRLRELQSDPDDAEFAEVEEDGSYVTTLCEFIRGAGVPAIVLDSEKNIQKMNADVEDIVGFRESSSQGLNLIDVAREKGFAATIMELCDESGNNGGTCQEGTYELSGHVYEIYITSLLGKDNLAKAFYVTFLKEG
jgi:hypothetical protein